MSKLGQRLIKGAEEALAIARGGHSGFRAAGRCAAPKFALRAPSGELHGARKAAKAAPAFKASKKATSKKRSSGLR